MAVNKLDAKLNFTGLAFSFLLYFWMSTYKIHVSDLQIENLSTIKRWEFNTKATYLLLKK